MVQELQLSVRRSNGVTVDNGVVYGNTADSTFAIQASTGEQLWIKKLTRNPNEGIDMAPGIHDGTLYVSTVPGNAKGFYKGNGQAILWAMDAKTGDVKWKWEEVREDTNPIILHGGLPGLLDGAFLLDRLAGLLTRRLSR